MELQSGDFILSLQFQISTDTISEFTVIWKIENFKELTKNYAMLRNKEGHSGRTYISDSTIATEAQRLNNTLP